MPSYSVVKFKNNMDKKKILKASREKEKHRLPIKK